MSQETLTFIEFWFKVLIYFVPLNWALACCGGIPFSYPTPTPVSPLHDTKEGPEPNYMQISECHCS